MKSTDCSYTSPQYWQCPYKQCLAIDTIYTIMYCNSADWNLRYTCTSLLWGDSDQDLFISQAQFYRAPQINPQVSSYPNQGSSKMLELLTLSFNTTTPNTMNGTGVHADHSLWLWPISGPRLRWCGLFSLNLYFQFLKSLSLAELDVLKGHELLLGNLSCFNERFCHWISKWVLWRVNTA